MISANDGLPAHRYTPQVTQRWPQASELASVVVKMEAGLHVDVFVFFARDEMLD